MSSEVVATSASSPPAFGAAVEASDAGLTPPKRHGHPGLNSFRQPLE